MGEEERIGRKPWVLTLPEQARIVLFQCHQRGMTPKDALRLTLRKAKEITGIEPRGSLRTVERIWDKLRVEGGVKEYSTYIAKARELPLKPVSVRMSSEFKEWETKIRLSGSISALRYLSPMEKILTGKIIPEFKCDPQDFDLVKAQEFVGLWLKKHPKEKRVERSIRMSIRGFLMVAKGIVIPRGYGVQYGLSGEKESIGEYAHIDMTEEEMIRAREVLKSDLKTLTLFDLGIESFARATTLLTLKKSAFTAGEKAVTYSVHEEKTEVTFPKYLLLNLVHARETWEEVKELIVKEPDQPYLFLDVVKEPTKADVSEAMKFYGEPLRTAYRFVGKTDEYFYKKPFYSLRHIGAQLWLRRTNWDYAVVSEMGWDDLQTLRTWYGRLSEETLTKKIKGIEDRGAF